MTTFVVMAGTAWAGEDQTEIKITNEIDVAGKVQSNDAAMQGRAQGGALAQGARARTRRSEATPADGAGKFSFGNPGLEPGRYYVKAKRIRGSCAKGLVGGLEDLQLRLDIA